MYYDGPVPESQKNEAFETPSRDVILALTPLHVQALETSNDDSVWVAAGMHHLLLTTTGRKSGNTHKTPLPYWKDSDRHRIVVASFAGAERNPSWYHNLADKDANPTVRVQEREHVWHSAAEILEGDEYDLIWAALTSDRPFYIAYQTKTERVIPLVRLPEPS